MKTAKGRDAEERAERFARRFLEVGPWTTRRVGIGTIRYRRRRRREFLVFALACGDLQHALRAEARRIARWLSVTVRRIEP